MSSLLEIEAIHCQSAERLAATLSQEKGIYILNEVVINQFVIALGGDAPDDVQTQ
jgi:hypothetical protein